MFEKNTIADFERTTFKTAGCFKIMRTLNTISEKIDTRISFRDNVPKRSEIRKQIVSFHVKFFSKRRMKRTKYNELLYLLKKNVLNGIANKDKNCCFRCQEQQLRLRQKL